MMNKNTTINITKEDLIWLYELKVRMGLNSMAEVINYLIGEKKNE